MAVLPGGEDDLKAEGQALHHCVATYAGRVEKGETLIVFIRKESEPDKPYFTMEWRGKIIQCRGARNCDPPAEVRAFETEFEKALKSYNSKKRKKAVVA